VTHELTASPARRCRARVPILLTDEEISVTTLFVLVLLLVAFAVGRLFQWVRDARGVLRPEGWHAKDYR
jgi:hypothetical protein